MRDRANAPEEIADQVAKALSNAERQAAILLADAERQAAQVRPVPEAELRHELSQRIDRLAAVRAKVGEQRRRARARLREAAAVLDDFPGRVPSDTQSGADEPSFERVLTPVVAGPEGSEANRHPSQLAAVAKAAEAAADGIVKEARTRARKARQLAEREANEIVTERPRQLARAVEPAARQADSLRRRVEELTQSVELALNTAPARTHDGKRS